MTEQAARRGGNRARWLLAGYWVSLAVATHWPRLVVEGPPGLPLDKLAHALTFGLLAGLLRAALPRGRWWLACLIAAIYVPIDEFTQTWFERTFDPGDMIAGLTGVVVVSLFLIPARRPPEPLTAATGGGFVRHATLVGAMTFASRLTGLVRDAVVLALLGLSPINDAYRLGFQVPNLFRRLFGEGALTASFIPHYTPLAQQDAQLGRRFATQCMAALLALTAAITVVGELAIGAWVLWGDPSDKTRLGLLMTMAMLPYMPMICATALAGGALQVHHRFASPAAAPILLNVVMIGFAAWGWWIYRDTNPRGVAWMLALGVGTAGVVQLLWQLAAMGRSVGFDWRLFGGGTGAAIRGMLWMMLPMLIGLAVFQINTLMDSLIAFGLSSDEPGARLHLFGRVMDYPIEPGAVAALGGGQQLYQFPLGVFSIAIATAIFPALARTVDLATDDFGRTLRQGLRLSMFIGLPASMGLIVLREPMVSLFFEHGKFTADDTVRTATILAGYASGVWAYSLTHVLTRAFHARRDAKTPLYISLAMVALNFVLNCTLIWPLGAVGLAVSTAISGSCQTLLLMVSLHRRGVRAIDGVVAGSWGRTVGLTAVMSVVVWLATRWLPGDGTLGAAVATGVGVAVGAVVVIGGAWAIGAPEAKWLLRRRVSS